MASQPKTCMCGTALGPRNTSGRCQRCALRQMNKDPGIRKRRSEARRRYFAENPDARAALVEQGRRQFLDNRLWEAGSKARTKESFERGARTRTERMLAWCPPELRGEYRRLLSNKYSAEEAKALILDQHEADMRRFRASIGYSDPIDEAVLEPPPEQFTPTDAPLFERTTAAVKYVAGLTAPIWGDRREKPLVRARFAVMQLLRDSGWSNTQIAEEAGLDRTTVGYGLRQAAAMIEGDPDFVAMVEKAGEL